MLELQIWMMLALSYSFSFLCVKPLLPWVIIAVAFENLLYHDVTLYISYVEIFFSF